jgi:hypothetical protein
MKPIAALADEAIKLAVKNCGSESNERIEVRVESYEF